MRNIREKEQKLYPYSIKIQSYNDRLFKQLAEKLKKLNYPISVYEGKNIIQFDSWYCTKKKKKKKLLIIT